MVETENRLYFRKVGKHLLPPEYEYFHMAGFRLDVDFGVCLHREVDFCPRDPSLVVLDLAIKGTMDAPQTSKQLLTKSAGLSKCRGDYIATTMNTNTVECTSIKDATNNNCFRSISFKGAIHHQKSSRNLHEECAADSVFDASRPHKCCLRVSIDCCEYRTAARFLGWFPGSSGYSLPSSPGLGLGR